MSRHVPGLWVNWRTIEWVGAAGSIFLLSGAVFPLLLMSISGTLGGGERALLRMLQVPVILFTFGILARHPGPLLLAMRRTYPMVILIMMAFASVVWSIAPSISMRRAVALVASIVLAYFLAVRFTPRQLLVLFASVIGVCLGLSLVAALLVPQFALMPDGTGLRGVYSHKNVLGWASSLGFILSLGLIGDGARNLRRAGIVLLGMSVVCLALSTSSTGVFASTVSLILTGFYALLRRASGLRRAVLILVALQLAAVALLLLGTVLVPLLEHMGKDATLTGRVPLWELVDVYIAERFWTGYGYQAFWVPWNPDAQSIIQTLRWTPPHAHNGFRDVLLSFGAGGLFLLAWTILTAVRRAAWLHCNQPDGGWGWMNVTIGAMLVLNLSESSFLAQNDIQWLLMMTVIASVALYGGGIRRGVAPETV
ncbi:O-antigen ligase family protein [Jannaschia faecimaris]|uniref:O-antigen ligase family protein n=1 Tax=Jannaschia faecimaris TaxID=1244108 RepID=UPI001113FE0F|nr:O-antigen ligase family protein [Jannaschia faecimaris]